ncbi:MAG: Holliday junction resolvase RuvX [Desulfovibrionaceae bacterium]|nr:Holliday junction resolvase RuvX [Desulfovibrionaceae bacterium]
MRYVGIDYGLSRTGLAISDEEERFVFPLATFSLKDYPSRKDLLDALAAKIIEAKAEACVMGLPLPLEGPETLICKQIRNVTKRLQRRIPLPFYFMNEALSSEEAWADLKESGLKWSKRRKVLDQQAAVRILESFLSNKPSS